MNEEDFRHRLHRPSALRWEVLAPIMAGLLLIGFLLGFLVGKLA